MDPSVFTPLYDMPAHLLRRAAQRVTSVFEAEMGYLGLTASQLGLLIAVHLKPGLEQREIAEATHFDAATLGGVIRRLEAQGMIERRPSARSTRGQAVYLSARGEALYQQIEPHVSRIQQTLLSPLSGDESRVFMTLLSKLLGVNNTHCPGDTQAANGLPPPHSRVTSDSERRSS